jgi:acetyl-CoA synthetase
LAGGDRKTAAYYAKSAGHPPKGLQTVAAVVLAADALPETPDLAAVARDLLDTVREVMGGLARPRILLVVDRFGDELTASDRRKALATLVARDPTG